MLQIDHCYNLSALFSSQTASFDCLLRRKLAESLGARPYVCRADAHCQLEHILKICQVLFFGPVLVKSMMINIYLWWIPLT